jgi:hypothetical protein
LYRWKDRRYGGVAELRKNCGEKKHKKKTKQRKQKKWEVVLKEGHCIGIFIAYFLIEINSSTLSAYTREDIMKKSTSLTWFFLIIFSFTAFATENESLTQFGNGSEFARLSVVEGSINVSRDTEYFESVSKNFVIEPMDVIETEFASRAVVQFIDGSLLKLGENTKIDFLQIGGENDGFSFLVRLWQGKAYADISDDDTFKEREFRIDTKNATIFLLSAGKYRIDITDYESRVKTISGLAEISTENGSKLLRAGTKASIDDSSDRIFLANFNTFATDEFDRWATSTYNRQLTQSTRYVPKEIKHYVYELDDSGSWYYDVEVETYVWRPASVSIDWTPYTYGYWSYSPYGTTWVSYYSWGYAPFHYGSWYFSASLGWCWHPGIYYSPAWVRWSCWDNYVGWYPYSYRYRGQVVRHGIRDRVVYLNANHFYNRHLTVVRGQLPSRVNVVRTVKPIAPKPSRIVNKPVRAITTAIKHPVRVNSVRTAGVKPVKGTGNSHVTAVKPVKSLSTRGATHIRTNVKPIRTTPGRTVKPQKSRFNNPVRTVKPRSSTTGSTAGSIKIKTPTIRDRYVKPSRTISTPGTYKPTVKKPSYSKPAVKPSSSNNSSGSVKKPIKINTNSNINSSSSSYTKPNRTISRPVRTYGTPRTTRSYSRPTRSNSSSSGRSIRRR